MNSNNVISDQKMSIAHLGALLVFLVAILARGALPNSLAVSVIGISIAIPCLVSAAILFQLNNLEKSKALNRIFIVSFAVGHISGLFSFACVFFYFSLISGVVFTIFAIGLSGAVGYVFKSENIFEEALHHDDKSNT
jgi:hypothetical protein